MKVVLAIVFIVVFLVSVDSTAESLHAHIVRTGLVPGAVELLGGQEERLRATA